MFVNFKKSDKVWEWLMKSGIGFSKGKIERGSGLARSAVMKYKTDFNRLMKMVEKETGKNDPMKVKPNDVYKVIDKLIKEYHGGNKALANFLRGIDDALHAFKECSKASGVFKRELRLGDKRVISQKLNDEKVYRRSKDTTVMKASRDDMEKVVAQIEKSRASREVKDVAINVVRLEFESGRRISGILRSQVGNYDEKNGVFTTYGDKGGKDNESFYLSQGAKEILDKLSRNENGEKKKDGDMMFKVKYTQHKDPNKRGQDKSVDNIRKQVSNLIKNCAERADVNRDGQKFSSHSCRKGYANERADYYIDNMTAEERKEELERRKKHDKALSERIDKCLEHIKSKFKNEDKKEKREFTDIEIIKLLVSTDINHSRIDIIRYYLMDYQFDFDSND